MSILERVTISGADDSISPDSLAALSVEFPFVEWGILVSANNMNSPRYPSRKWMARLQDWSLQQSLRIAIHVQGLWLRKLLIGDETELVSGVGAILGRARRVQLNFHGAILHYNELPFIYAMQRLPIQPKLFLFQIDGCQGAALLARMEHYPHAPDCVPFYDTSHGAGVLPEKWLIAERTHARTVGYAGGLGPENVAEQLPLIAKAAGGHFWIDMEAKVRDNKRLGIFDLYKVRAVLEICAPFIGKEI